MIKGEHKLLLIEDNPDDVELTRRAFARSNIVEQLVVVTDGEAALNYLFAIGPHADRDPYALCRRRSCSTSTCRR
jgi:hypothetical protein